MLSKGSLILLWVFFVHLAGIYLFTSGFLLTRLALTESNECSNCTLPATHNRAVFLIIDALRFDFVSPEPPLPVSPYHHNVLTLPAELTASRPRNSFIFNAYADPPTTTLQRIKGLTTGSLPTFVDLGNNFGGSSIAEDSIIKQLNANGKKAAFMGDDTWMSVFPDAFQSNMTFPFDSFNVEDLHTVDEGVIAHIFPFLEDKSKPFDFLVGHFLGVDHVGHRVGPDHPSMKAKLQQMNDVLRRIVDLLDDDTLLVVLGDHGMDRSGDHGGDGILETSSAMWIYSKGPELSLPSASISSGLLRYTTFPDASVPHRSIQQIDILPTLSLLLGLPIPFNNLGTIIPEIFLRDEKGTTLTRALEINAAQVHEYLEAYRSSPSGNELDEAWDNLQNAWIATQATALTHEQYLITLSNYTRVALSACRAMWAQFNPLLMGLGLALLGVGILATWSVYSGLSDTDHRWETWLEVKLMKCLRGIAGGSVLGLLGSLAFEPYLQGIDTLDCILFAAPFASCILILFSSPPKLALSAFPLPLALHAVSFLSNSFTFWEDRIMTFLTISSLIPFVLTGFQAPTSRLRRRILGFSLLFAVCVRLMAFSTVCREEQHPYCHVTFYASSSIPETPRLILSIVLPVGLIVPFAFKRILQISKSHHGLAGTFLPYVLRPLLLVGSGYWILERMDTTTLLGVEQQSGKNLRLIRTVFAMAVFIYALFGGGTFWWTSPLCLAVEAAGLSQTPQVKASKEKDRKQVDKSVNVLGFANAFGSSYLMFWSIFLSLIYITTQLTGQVVLALSAVALVSLLEVIDSARDVTALEAAFASSKPSVVLNNDKELSPTLRFAEIVPVALLGMHAFYRTGHQSTISSIQWKSAFLLTETVSYPFSPLTVILNTFGPIFLFGLAVPLLALWNRSPKPTSGLDNAVVLDAKVKGESVLASLGVMMYYAVLLFGTAVSAAILRRHLMVWKVFAPRFMAGAVGVLVVDVAVLLGFCVGVQRVCFKINQVLGFQARRDIEKGTEGTREDVST